VARAQLEQTSQHLLAVASVHAKMQNGCGLIYALEDAWQLSHCFAECMQSNAQFENIALA
jgi:hypothetical protein